MSTKTTVAELGGCIGPIILVWIVAGIGYLTGIFSEKETVVKTFDSKTILIPKKVLTTDGVKVDTIYRYDLTNKTK